MHLDLKQLYFLSYCTSNNKIGSSIVLRRITTDHWAKTFLWSSRFNLNVISDVKILNLIFVLSYINNQRMAIADYFVILCEKIFGWVDQNFGWVVQNNWVSWLKTWVSYPRSWVSWPILIWVSWFLGELS